MINNLKHGSSCLAHFENQRRGGSLKKIIYLFNIRNLIEKITIGKKIKDDEKSRYLRQEKK